MEKYKDFELIKNSDIGSVDWYFELSVPEDYYNYIFGYENNNYILSSAS